MSTPDQKSSSFAAAGTGARQSILREFTGFLAQNKKWWLLPIVIALLLMGLLILAAGSGAAPFIYSLF